MTDDTTPPTNLQEPAKKPGVDIDALLVKYNAREEIVDRNGEVIGIKWILPNLGELIYNEFGYYFFTLEDNEEIYCYNGSFYEPNGEHNIRTMVEEILGETTTEHHKNEVTGYIRDKRYIKRETLNPPIHLLNLHNGILDLNDYTLQPHSPEYFFVNELPLNYDPNASYERFDGFVKHISMKEGNIRQEIVDTIQEYLGYSLLQCYPFKYYIVLDGGGDNGKTVLLTVVVALIGANNNTSVSLQELNDRPFAKAQLYAKYTNVSDDLPKKALKHTGVIKQITGNSPMWADIKNHKKGINFVNYAKPWYACNELPETNDYTDAFFSRQIQITLLNKYLPKGDPKINGVNIFERNVNLSNELTELEQLSGILNYALIGLKRLQENKNFTDPTSTEEKRNTWLRKTNPIVAFLEEECEIGSDDWCITKDDFYSEVSYYCERNGFDKPTSQKYVTERILDAGLGIKKQQKTINGEPRTWCWIGVRCTTNTVINYNLGELKQQVIL